MENPSTSMMSEFVLYNNWANQQILAACQTLTDEQLSATNPGAYGTIHRTLGHLIYAEADYAERLTGTSLQPPFRWEDGPGVAEIAAFAVPVGQALLKAVQRVKPSDAVIERWEEGSVQYQALALFIQIINHGIEHRTNITTILVQQNLPAPEVDGWGYLWSHKDKFGASVTRKAEADGK